jgi:hypothetical protein
VIHRRSTKLPRSPVEEARGQERPHIRYIQAAYDYETITMSIQGALWPAACLRDPCSADLRSKRPHATPQTPPTAQRPRKNKRTALETHETETRNAPKRPHTQRMASCPSTKSAQRSHTTSSRTEQRRRMVVPGPGPVSDLNLSLDLNRYGPRFTSLSMQGIKKGSICYIAQYRF